MFGSARYACLTAPGDRCDRGEEDDDDDDYNDEEEEVELEDDMDDV